MTTLTSPPPTTAAALVELVAEAKRRFVGKDEILDVMAVALVAGENVFLYGPPGTAKSALVSTLTAGISDDGVGTDPAGGRGGAFEYLLTRFTEPSELFGPFDLRRLREGDLVTNTAGMLPEATTVFLDEIFNANSAILNSLLLALNERRFRRGQETRELPALLFAGASNHLPDDEALEALFDRFLLRVRCQQVSPAQLPDVLTAGRALSARSVAELPQVSAESVRALQVRCRNMDVAPVAEAYLELILSARRLGVQISDRRAVKIQNLIAASALLCGRDTVDRSDLWVMRYVWDSDEQIAPLAALVDAALQEATSPAAHPQAHRRGPDAESLAVELDRIEAEWSAADARRRSALKDELRHLQDQLPWLAEGVGRDALTGRVEAFWQNILARS